MPSHTIAGHPINDWAKAKTKPSQAQTDLRGLFALRDTKFGEGIENYRSPLKRILISTSTSPPIFPKFLQNF